MVGLSTIHGVSLAIDLQDVTKTYRGGVQALRGVSLRVQSGEIFGLLGPNGAGKSTLVKIIMTVVRPTTLTGTVLGRPACTQEVLSQVGYLPEHHRFPQYLTGRQVVDFFGALAKVQRTERKARTEQLLEMVGMRDWGNRRVTTYSKGMQQRTGLAAALVNDPQLVVLDEPTDGVDPVGRSEIRDVLLRMRDEGRTVFLNSHLLGEVELVCDRVAIMLKGRIEVQGSLAELTQASRRWRVTFEGTAPAGLPAFGRAVPLPGGSRHAIELAEGEVERVQALIDALRAAGCAVVGVHEVRESLEELFLRLVRDVDGRVAAVGAANVNAAMRESR